MMHRAGWRGAGLAAALLLAGMLASPGRAVGATSAEDVKRELREAVEAAKAYGYERKDDYEQKVEAALSRLEKDLREMKAKAEEAGAKAREEAEAAAGQLERKAAAARVKLEELRSATGEAWMDVKAGTADVLDDLERTYERVRSRY